ncbi:GMP-PDE, delta subunit family protein [Angomonas deanei]|uniref:GMP-PDE, delta subunit, putative n=1 Tax=Angomonas deanei TaxID=59799 RepID=S9V6D7_9TRYP|nr:GMP-PDE, delta subunit family protein [Angomonas deanei]EPY38046.1 GMP-PDE, delta subunit family protein [Angomonas deanei]CAD2221495.1 GMP-PDE, delta subunit, putative [Angomonas deanei]|eukprot:EPY36619.1 GMP-PDE, delta subunit family protein [Angomonas deanei]
MAAKITPEQCLAFTAPTEDFLCPLTANTYGLEFYRFTIRDLETSAVVFDMERSAEDFKKFNEMIPHLTEDQKKRSRSIHYRFPSNFLTRKAIGAKLVFGVNGDKPVPNFRMIERHYFRNTLVKSFDFKFSFCIPHSTNTWESIYDVPNLSPEWLKAIQESPFETVSDSFYFVNDELIMHNKAYYAYDGKDL